MNKKEFKKVTKDNEKKIFWSNSTLKDADVIMFGMPYDRTASHKKGTTNAFNSIRNEAEVIEIYSPILDRSLDEIKIFDAGDLKIEKLTSEQTNNEIYNFTKKILENNKFFIGIGGEHSISYGEVKALFEKYKDLHVIHIDAHTDLRDVFQGEYYSHANVIKRIYDLVGKNRIYSFGIRSGSKEEFDFYKKKLIYCEQNTLKTISKIIKKLANKPIFITIDIDVLDPSIMSGTGTTEPGGVCFRDLMSAIYQFKNLKHIVGVDLVELSPDWDISLSSTCVAIKILRELILTIVKNK